MKKLLLILLAITMCVSMCACGGNENTNSNTNNNATNNTNNNATNNVSKNDGSIELTADNYDKYINIVNVFCKRDGERFYATINVKGRSANFNYNDIKLEINFKGTCEGKLLQYDANLGGMVTLDSYMTDYDSNHTVEPDISGNYLGEYDILILKDGYQASQDSIDNFEYEIVSVSGTVTPA